MAQSPRVPERLVLRLALESLSLLFSSSVKALLWFRSGNVEHGQQCECAKSKASVIVMCDCHVWGTQSLKKLMI